MRTCIQSKLNELTDIESGDLLPDGMIENGITYFGYSLQENYVKRNQDKKNVKRISLIGFLIRKNNPTENTVEILDGCSTNLLNKLSELNFKLDLKDIDMSNDIRKKQITGYVYLNETNNELVF